MLLPDNFQFSQSSLQDYIDCPRRFQLRYIQRLAWPAVEAEPVIENERRKLLGDGFHRMVQQHLVGIPSERLSRMVNGAVPEGDLLCDWWENYLGCLKESRSLERLSNAEILHLPEISLSAPLCGYRLVAKYDAVTLQPAGEQLTARSGQPPLAPFAVIFDWKTSPKRTNRKRLADRLQSRVYPYLMVSAGAAFNLGQPVQPEQVELVYWFAGFPNQPERFPYCQEQYLQDTEYLTGLVSRISACGEDDFAMAGDENRCLFCTYRSLCDRGIRAAIYGEADESAQSSSELEISLDLEQVQEISF